MAKGQKTPNNKEKERARALLTTDTVASVARQLGRPWTTIYGWKKEFEKDGSFDRREEWEYAYHDNGYRSQAICKTYDSEDKLLGCKTETYDEKGNLVSSVTE